MFNKKISLVIGTIATIFFLNGCAVVIQKGRRSDIEKIGKLRRELEDLRSAKLSLEKKLQQEIESKQVKLKMEERGLVITVLGEVLFDSGKDVLRKESYPVLDKIAKVLNKEDIKNHDIGVEGYTDNQPIKYSKWKSNWELSAHRALSVLHYLEKRGVDAARMQAIGYGEYRPVASNATAEGRQLNRRVEIVIMPQLHKEVIVSPSVAEEPLLK